jgi:hypothetical protein
MALDYKELDKRFNELLAKETKWSITVWLYKDRIRQWYYNLKNKF